MQYRIAWMGVMIACVATLSSVSASADGSSWNGPYIGLVAGVALTDARTETNSCATGSLLCEFDRPIGTKERLNAPFHFEDTKFTGGVQFGYNWQLGSVVVGLEGDITALRMHASRDFQARFNAGNTVGVNAHESVSTNYLGTLRGRLGMVFGNLLVYGTGGLAITDFKHETSYGEYGFGAAAPCAGASFENYCQPKTAGYKSFGVTIGGGLEWSFAQNWSLKGEYLYVDFGTAASAAALLNGAGRAPVFGNGLTHQADLTAHLARAGINYRF